MVPFKSWVEKKLVEVRKEATSMPAEFWHTRRLKTLEQWENQLMCTLHMITEYEATALTVEAEKGRKP